MHQQQLHPDVISMCVVTLKVKYRDSNSVYSTFPMLDKGWDVTLPGMLCQIQPYENFRKKGSQSLC